MLEKENKTKTQMSVMIHDDDVLEKHKRTKKKKPGENQTVAP